VARRTQSSGSRVMEPAVLRSRVETALREGRQQQALDFARTLFDFAPSPENRALLVRTTLDEAERLLASRQHVQAGTMASRAWKLASQNDEKARLAELMARCGNLAQALLLAEQLNTPVLSARILGHAADAAIRNKSAPTSGLPADFAAHHAVILRASAEITAGQDDQARQTLQGVGLGSPFLEWKVFLRGLLAYYQADDPRALENWQRLDPHRVPAQLAAPLRLQIDSAFRAAQPAETRGRLLAMMSGMEGSGLVAQLRTLKSHLANERQLAQAFRQAGLLLPRLQAEAPEFVSTLAHCFFWSIIDHGNPEDLQRYTRVFGAPVEDPELDRLEALALEHRDAFRDAHICWQAYEKSLALRAAALPAGHADRMRALVWHHMGQNAARMPDDSLRRHLRDLPFGGFRGLPRPLTPAAETCFKRGLELAPDQLESHTTLVRHYLKGGQAAKALKAGKQLLKRFPTDAQTLELVGDLALKQGNNSDAVSHFSRAIQANPLNKLLRDKLAAAHLAAAESHMVRRNFEKAREVFKAALDLRENANHYQVYVPWAACEFLANDPVRAEELLAQANSDATHRLAVAFAMLVNVIKLKLGKALKTRFEREFNDLLSQPPTAAMTVALATEAVRLFRAGDKYVGQKSHEKKVLAYLDKARRTEFSEVQLGQLCEAFTALKSKQLTYFFTHGQHLFPANPRFILAEADFELSKLPRQISHLRVARLLERVRELASALPAGQRDSVLTEAQARAEKLLETSPLPNLFDIPDLDDMLDNEGFDDEFLDGEDDEEDWDDF
jgi:tetratricopeptide (TPR) repeat protein